MSPVLPPRRLMGHRVIQPGQDVASERAFFAKFFSANVGERAYHRWLDGDSPAHPAGAGPRRRTRPGGGTEAHAVRCARRGCDVIAADLTRDGGRAARVWFP